jgi:hypothetical protein
MASLSLSSRSCRRSRALSSSKGEALEDAVGVFGGPHVEPLSIRRELTGRQIPVQLPQHLRLPLMDGPSLGHPGQQRPGAEEHQPRHIFYKG